MQTSSYAKSYNVAIYCRLSRDDGVDAVSSSIQSQIEFITEYVEKRNWNIVDYYCDDGYSGTNFNRPNFKRLLADIEVKRVNCIVTKDLSRLGRNYIETGFYTENYFPSKKVRYIAINDNFDTNSDIENDFAPFKNIINEWYAKDISKKVKSSFEVKKKNGEQCSGMPLFGYKLVNNKREISEEEANIVKLIFEEYLKTESVSKIFHTLKALNIYTPKYYLYYRYGWYKDFYLSKNDNEKYNWNEDQILRIIKNDEYTGLVHLNKSHNLSFKNKKKILNSKEEYITYEAPAIITKDIYDQAIKIFEKNKRKRQPLEEDTFRGLVKCPLCGKTMYFVKRTIRKKTGNKEYSAYTCFNKECGQTANSLNQIKVIVKKELQALKELLLKHSDTYNSLLIQKSLNQEKPQRTINTLNKEKRKKLVESSKAIDKKIDFLITSKTMNEIPLSTYQNLMKQYTQKKNEIELELNTLENEQEIQVNNNLDFLDYGKKFASTIMETDDDDLLDMKVISSLIERIEPTSKRMYVKRVQSTMNVIIRLNITYQKIDNIVKELQEYEQNSYICES